MASVFLSHSHKDRDVAKRVANDLTKEGIQVWLDEWEILVGDSITQRVQQGLEQVNFVAPLLTAHSVDSGWVEKEWQSQIGLEAERKQIRVLPVRGDNCEIPILLRDKRYADLNADYREGLDQLVRAIHGHSSRHTQDHKKPSTVPSLTPQLKKRHIQRHWRVYALIAIGLVVLAIGAWIVRNQFGSAKREYTINQNKPAEIFARRSHIVTPAESYKIREVLQLPVVDYSNFELLEDRRVIDLRDWKPFQSGEPGRVSPVTWSRKVRLRKTKEAEWVRFAFATEGAGIDAECASGQDYHLETGVAPSYPLQVLMKSFHVVVNVTQYKIGEEFDLELLATLWNGSAEREDWAAYKVHAPMKTTSMMILFPDKKPFQWKKMVMYKPNSPDEFPPPDWQRKIVYTPDNRMLYWEIDNPIPYNTYEIQWGW